MRFKPQLRSLLPTLALATLLAAGPALAVVAPPERVNYQGVLRSAAGAPLSGSSDVIFRFYDAAAGGSELLVDSHLAAGTGAVTAAGGLFSVALGSGQVQDGAAPGTIAGLGQLFREHAEVWLQVEVNDGGGFQVLSPRTRIAAAPYALSAGSAALTDTLAQITTVQGTGGKLLSTPTLLQLSAGDEDTDQLILAAGNGAEDGSITLFGGQRMALRSGNGVYEFYSTPGAPTPRATLDSQGLRLGASRSLLDGPAALELRAGVPGTDQLTLAAGAGIAPNLHLQAADSSIRLFANTFRVVDGTGLSQLLDLSSIGDLDLLGDARLRGGDLRLGTDGNVTLGRSGSDLIFTPSIGHARFTTGNVGIGTLTTLSDQPTNVPTHRLTVGGGAFGNNVLRLIGSGASGSGARLDFGDFGIVSISEFADDSLKIASGGRLLVEPGFMGLGPLQDLNAGPTTFPTHALTIGGNNAGLRLIGTGVFGSGSRLAFGDGVTATSLDRVFIQEDVDDALLIQATFGRISIMPNTGVGIGTLTPASGRKLNVVGSTLIQGNFDVSSGTKNFVQNLPFTDDLWVVYTALEGDEAGTYTRGSARLSNGVAVVALGESFAWVTNPDIGLTAHVTPRGEWADLYVESVSTSELVVRSRDAAGGEVAFDYMVHGLRLGFEEHPVIQERVADAPVPSPAYYDREYAGREGLRGFSALARFREMDAEVWGRAATEMTAAASLRAGTGQFEVAPGAVVAQPAGKSGSPPPGLSAGIPAAAGPGASAPVTGKAGSAAGARQGQPAGVAAVPVDPTGDVRARSFHASATELATPVLSSEVVETGDVLVIDPSRPGWLRLSREEADTRVFGVATDTAGVVLGAAPADPSRADQVTVATAGVVLCRVDAAFGAVEPGDLLVTSPTPGHAMRADAPRAGTVLGKALEPLAAGTGTIRVLVTLR